VPYGRHRAKIPEADHTSLPERGEATKNVEPSLGIQQLGATAFEDLRASEEGVEAFAI